MSKQKVTGTRFENDIVDRAQKAGLTASRQPGSGVYKAFPSDAVIENTLIEAKVRSPLPEIPGGLAAVRVEYQWLNKVIANARKNHELGAVVVRPKGQQKCMVLLDFDDFLALLHHQKA